MRKAVSLIFLAALLLTACGSAAQTAPTATVAPTPAPTLALAAERPQCTVEASLPAVDPDEAARFAPVTAEDWVIGAMDAKITLLEYSDFMCPYCAQIAPILEQVARDNPEDVRFVYRHFPLPSHDKSTLASQAAEAAGKQDKFWEMYNLLFAQQSTWVNKSMEEFRPWLIEQAKTLDLDVDTFTADIDSSAIVEKIQQAKAAGETAQVNYTPYLVVDNRIYPEQLPHDYATITAMVRLIQLQDQQYAACPPQTIDPQKQYLATFKTDQGDFTVQLYADKAPVTVNNFLFLAREGWYDNVSFHRVLPGFVAQTGDPTGTGFGGPGFAYINETSDLKFDQEGVLAMANSGPDTNGSQFFITYAPLAQLDGDYSIFGQVIEGMDVVKKLTPRDPENEANPPQGDLIREIVIIEK
jgi:cyclophilin family peptidyl-prolyl cis-trans isomerase/protein-disulfide isomerase